jgi:hypothetical protein
MYHKTTSKKQITLHVKIFLRISNENKFGGAELQKE